MTNYNETPYFGISQPTICSAKVCHNSGDTNINEESYVVNDPANFRMQHIILSISRSSASSNQTEFMNNQTGLSATIFSRKRTKVVNIAIGYIQKCVRVVVVEHGKTHIKYIGKINSRLGIRSFEMTEVEFLTNDTKLKQKLERAGLILLKPSSLQLIRAFIANIAENHDGVECDKLTCVDGTLMLTTADDFRRDAVDGTKLHFALGLSTSTSPSLLYGNLLVFALAVYSECINVFQLKPMSPVAVMCSNSLSMNFALQALSGDYFCFPQPTAKALNSLSDHDSTVVINLDSVSGYHAKKTLSTLAFNTYPTAIPVVISQKSLVEINSEVSRDFLSFSFESIAVPDLKASVAWFIKQMLDDKSFRESVLDDIQEFQERFNEEYTEGRANTAAAILSIAHRVALSLNFDIDFQGYIGFVESAMTGITNDLSVGFIKAIKSEELSVFSKTKFLEHEGDGLLLHGGKLFMSSGTAKKIAHSLGVKVSTLTRGLGDIIMQQKSVDIHGTCVRLYPLSAEHIFSLGEIRPQIDTFAESKPALMLPIGECNGNDTFISFQRMDGSVNTNIGVLGTTRTGKTTFLKRFAISAIKAGLPVITLVTESSRIDFRSDVCIEISGEEAEHGDVAGMICGGIITQIVVDEELLDITLRRLFQYHAKNNSSPCVLILDEITNFDMGKDSVVVKQVLGQGIKHGIISVFATQNLDSTSGDSALLALGLCGTIVQFRHAKERAAYSLFDAKADNSELRDVLYSLEQGQALIMGQVSTNRDYCNYPVKVKVEKVD